LMMQHFDYKAGGAVGGDLIDRRDPVVMLVLDGFREA
jgi:hypothetical protein